MLVRRPARAILAACTVASAAILVAGCAMNPGDYQAYRIAYASAPHVASCYADGKIPLDDKYDKTTFETGATFVVYLDADGDAWLDTGSQVLAGSIDGDSSTFSGKTTDVNYVPGSTIFDSDHDGIDDGDDPFVDADADGYEDKGDDPEVDVDMDGLDDRFADNLVDANGDGKDDRTVELPSDTKITTTLTLTIDMTANGPGISGQTTGKVTVSCKGSVCPSGINTSCAQTQKFNGIKIDKQNFDFGVGASSGQSQP